MKFKNTSCSAEAFTENRVVGWTQWKKRKKKGVLIFIAPGGLVSQLPSEWGMKEDDSNP